MEVQESLINQKKTLFATDKGDVAFAVGVLIAMIFTSVFGIFGGFALGYLISVVLMLTLFTFYFAKSGKFSFFSLVSGVLSLLNAAVFITTTNGSVKFFAVLVSFLLAICYSCGIIFGKVGGNRKTLGIFYSAVSTVGNIGTSLKSIFQGRGGNKKTFAKAMVGFICALPVLLVIIPLLISSDYAFKGFVSGIFKNTASTFFKSIFGVILSFFVISFGLSVKFGAVAEMPESKAKGVQNVYLVSFLSSISVCYLLYLFSQLAYFFNAFKGFLPDGEISYAEYARKGFFEMCAIAVINLIIVFITFLIAKKKKGKTCHTIKALGTFISMFTLVIIATAISKMVLYIDAYGMTVKRLTTSAFMVFLGVVFIAVALRIYIRKINIIKTALIAAGCIVLILGTLNVNAVCAKYNYENYFNGRLRTIDVNAIYNLGDEGVPYLVKLACVKDTTVAREAQNYLTDIYTYKYFNNMIKYPDFTVEDLKQNRKDTEFSKYSIPTDKAYDALYSFIEKNPTFNSVCQRIREERQSQNIHSDYSDFHSDDKEETYY